MTPLFAVAFAVTAVLFTAAALLSVYRIVRGPSILDRMIASDVLLTTLMLVVGAEMVYNGHTRTIPVMLVLSATAVFATIAVARYVSRQDLATKDEADELDVSMEEPAAGTSTYPSTAADSTGSSTRPGSTGSSTTLGSTGPSTTPGTGHASSSGAGSDR